MYADGSAVNTTPAPLKLLYLAGESRSGTTLLEMTLGQIPGLWPAGELRYLWSRGLVENQLCGCQSKFHECALWRTIIASAFGKEMLDSPQHARELCELQARVDQPRSVFRNAFFSPKRYTGAFRQHREQYIEALGRLYRGIQHATGAQWIIDSSKAPSHGWLAAGVPDIHMHVVHVVRDCRAVAFSMQRRKRRPEITDRQAFMPTYPAWKTAMRWVLINKVCRQFATALQKNGERQQTHTGYTAIRYEDFIRQPRTVVATIMRDIGMTDKPLDHIQGDTVHLRSNHTVAGNPIRFKTGDVQLKLDDQWRRELPMLKTALVRGMAGRMLRQYAYLD